MSRKSRKSLLKYLFKRRSNSEARQERHRATRGNRRLTSEQLERRQLFAVDIAYDAASDVLNLTSDGASDRVQIDGSTARVAVKVNESLQRILDLSLSPVARIVFKGNAGDDALTNNTSIPSTAYGGPGNDLLIGGLGTDNLYGDTGIDWLSGRDGDDRMDGGGDDDVLSGDNGNDSLSGSSGNDKLVGGAHRDWLFGESGDDILVGGTGDDLLFGGEGNDTFDFASELSTNGYQMYLGSDEISDLSGHSDYLDFSRSRSGIKLDLSASGVQLVNAYHRLKLGSSIIEIVQGSNLDDQLIGNSANNTLNGNDGNDKLDGRVGNDTLNGGTGNDRLIGGDGDDTFRFDSVTGAGGVLRNLGTDTIDDSIGNDTLNFFYSSEGVMVDLSSRSEQVVSPNLRISLAFAAIDRIEGSNKNDILVGNSGANQIYGNGGDDRLYGRAGVDILDGGSGDDGLFGGEGQDTLKGGFGDDRFLLDNGRTGQGDDVVTDFNGRYDAKAVFRNGTALNDLSITGRDSNARWSVAAGAWTDLQIEAVDAALANVQSATANTRLLKRANDPQGSSPLTYYMQGKATLTAGSDGFGIGAWNRGGDVYFVENVNPRTVYHEIGHNWDQASELGDSRHREWLSLSGWSESKWVNYNPALPDFGLRPSRNHVAALASDTLLWVLKDAVFAEEYGRVNSMEDMATTFDAYFSKHGNIAKTGTGLSANPTATTSIDAIPQKKRFLESLFASLT